MLTGSSRKPAELGSRRSGFLWINIATAATLICATEGCTGLMPSASVKAIKAFYCGEKGEPGAYVPVHYSRNDTDESIAQNRANNAVYDATCK